MLWMAVGWIATLGVGGQQPVYGQANFTTLLG